MQMGPQNSRSSPHSASEASPLIKHFNSTVSSLSYMLSLAAIGNELCETARQVNSKGYQNCVTEVLMSRTLRHHLGDSTIGGTIHLTLREWILLKREFRVHGAAISLFQQYRSLVERLFRKLGMDWNQTANDADNHAPFAPIFQLPTAETMALDWIETAMDPELLITSVQTLEASRVEWEAANWELEFLKFRHNVRQFCRRIGSEIDDDAMPQEMIKRLRQYSSDRRKDTAALYDRILELTQQHQDCKRMLTALEIRHTIENLVKEVSDVRPYRTLTGTGSKWKRLWKTIWTKASRNVNSPFHEVWKMADPRYERDTIGTRGKYLFADMSSCIHNYDGENLDFERFDFWTRKIANVLAPRNRSRTGDIDWKKENRRYSIDGLPDYVLDPMTDDNEDRIHIRVTAFSFSVLIFFSFLVQ